MERKIGETFKMYGLTFQVVEGVCNHNCQGCYFYYTKKKCFNSKKRIGECINTRRSDYKKVIFKEVKNEGRDTKTGV